MRKKRKSVLGLKSVHKLSSIRKALLFIEKRVRTKPDPWQFRGEKGREKP
jgi:hypothetical protein